MRSVSLLFVNVLISVTCHRVLFFEHWIACMNVHVAAVQCFRCIALHCVCCAYRIVTLDSLLP